MLNRLTYTMTHSIPICKIVNSFKKESLSYKYAGIDSAFPNLETFRKCSTKSCNFCQLKCNLKYLKPPYLYFSTQIVPSPASSFVIFCMTRMPLYMCTVNVYSTMYSTCVQYSVQYMCTHPHQVLLYFV